MAYFIGFGIGVAVGFLGSMIGCHMSHKKRAIRQEKEYAVLQQHVDKAVDSIERIIYGGE